MTDERLIIENMFMIVSKEKEDIPFTLNETQQALDTNMTGRDIIPKARQEGVSSYILALFLVRCLHIQNTRAVVISHDQESTEKLFKKVKYYLDTIRGPKAVLETSSKRELTFPKTNSVFYIGTAGARKFGRGDTITDLHCSEVAFWENPKELTSGLFQSVPRSGTILLESTGNGKNWFHKRTMKAYEGKGRYRCHFFNWQNFNEYDLKLTESEKKHILDTLDPEMEEVNLYENNLLTLGQIQFRREKLEELDYDLELFKQEYPMTIEECFKSTGRSVFYKVWYQKSKAWQKQSLELSTLAGHPKVDLHYIIGADVGGGVRLDNSVIEVVCLETGEQVVEWVSNIVPPDAFAKSIANLGNLYNNAYIVVEANSHGILTLSELRGTYPTYLIHKKNVNTADRDSELLRYGLLQTSRTKPLSIGLLRKLLIDTIKIHSPLLRDELDTFIENDGKLEAEEGCFDDRVMAMAALAYGFERGGLLVDSAPRQRSTVNDPFSLDAIIKELSGRGRNFPIKPQVGNYANFISSN